MAAGIHERAARVAGIESGVGLDDIVDQTAILGSERSADGADDARRDRRLEAERIADRDSDLPGRSFFESARCA
jgi:hypothetical protein